MERTFHMLLYRAFHAQHNALRPYLAKPGLLDSLQKGGFVSRHPDPDDRRRELIELTELGRTAYGQWQQRCQQMEQTMLAGFSPEERANFSDYLARAYQNLKAERRKSGEGL